MIDIAELFSGRWYRIRGADDSGSTLLRFAEGEEGRYILEYRYEFEPDEPAQMNFDISAEEAREVFGGLTTNGSASVSGVKNGDSFNLDFKILHNEIAFRLSGRAVASSYGIGRYEMSNFEFIVPVVSARQ